MQGRPDKKTAGNWKNEFAIRKERNCMRKKIGYVLFTAGIVMSVIGIPYLLDYSNKEILKYPLYAGLILTVAFAPLKAK